MNCDSNLITHNSKYQVSFPREAILERAAASGILVHELAGGKLVLKGRRRSDSASLPPGAAVPVKVGSAPN